MRYSIYLHPDVEKYLDSLSVSEMKRCYEKLKKLSEDPFRSRPGCDIKKMVGREIYYRLRVGDHRFLYIVAEDEILVEEAFRRGKGY